MFSVPSCSKEILHPLSQVLLLDPNMPVWYCEAEIGNLSLVFTVTGGRYFSGISFNVLYSSYNFNIFLHTPSSNNVGILGLVPLFPLSFWQVRIYPKI